MNKTTPETIWTREIRRKNTMPLRAGSTGLLRLCMMAAMLGLLLSSAHGQTFSWDASGANAGAPTDGTGTWSATNLNWSNGSSDAGWTSGNAVIGNANGAAGTITVSGSLSVGNITFNAPSSGAYTISSGTLALTSGTITDNNTLGVTTINSVLAGSVGLTTAGSGTLALGGTDIYTGNTTIGAGNTLEIVGSGQLGSTGTYSGTIANAGALVLSSSTNQVLSGTISGTGSLTQAGTGLVTLSANDTYTGATTVSSGTLNVTGGISTSSPITIGKNGSSNATYEATSASNITIASLATATGATGATLLLNPTNNFFFIISGATTLNSPLTVKKPSVGVYVAFDPAGITGVGGGTGNDSLIFSNLGSGGGGVQMYIQGSAGTYNYSGNVHFLNSAGALYIFQGVSIFASTASVTIDSGATLQQNVGGNYVFDALNGGGGWSANGQALTLTMGSANGSGTFSGVIQSTMSVAKAGTGTEIFTGSNTYTGSTVVNNGTLQIGNGGAAGSAGWISTSSAVSGSSGGTLAFNWNNSGTFTNAITGGVGVAQIGSGTLVLSGSYGYTGATSVNSGVLNVTGTLGSSAVSVANAATLGGSGKIGGLVTVNGGGIINLSSAVQTLTLSNGLTIGNNTTPSVLDFAGNGSGFSLINATGSTLTVSGSTTINITALATLTPGTYNLITFTSATGLGSFNLATTTIGSNNLMLTNTTTSEEIVVTSITPTAYWKGGNGTAWNATGPTNWTSDQAGTTGTAAPTSGVDVYFTANGVTTPLTTSLGTNFDIHSLNFNSTASNAVTISDATHNLTIEGSGINVLAGSGAHTISVNSLIVNASQAWNNNSSSLFTVTNGIVGAAGSGTTTTLSLAGSGTGGFLLSGVIGDGSGGGKLALTVSGANEMAILAGNNTYSGSTTITSGTLQVGNGGTAGALPSGTIADNGTLQYDLTNNVTVANIISGTGALAQIGSGTLILTATNTVSGTTTISAGTLQLGDGATNNGSVGGNIVDNAALVFADPTAQTYNGVISGSGSVLKNGAGMETLGGTSTYTGATTVSTGTLNVTGAISASSPITIGGNGSSNATFEIALPTSENIASLTTGSGATGATLLLNPTFTSFLTVTGTTTLNSPLTITKVSSGGNWAVFSPTGITGTGGGTGNDSLIFSNLGGIQMYIQANAGTYNYSGNVHFLTSNGATYTIQGSSFFATTASVTLDAGAAITNNTGSNFTFDALNGAGLWNGGSNVLTIGSANGSGTFSGTIGNSAMSVVKAGTGTEIFTGANTYTGSTVVNNGTLQLGNNGATGAIASTSAVSGSSGGTLAFNLNNSGTFTNAMSGGVGLTQLGSGTLTLSSTYAYTGATTVNLGNLSVTGTLSSSAATVTANTGSIATLSGNGNIGGLVTTTGTSGSVGVAHIAPGVNVSGANSNFGAAGTLHLGAGLTIGNGTNLDFDLGTSSDLIAVTGALSLGNNVVLNVNQAAGFATNTVYTLLTYTGGSLSGNTSLWTVGTGGPAGYTAQFASGAGVVTVDFVPTNTSTLAITPSPISLGNVLVGYTPTSVSGTITNNGTTGTGTYTLVATGSASASGSGTLAASGGATAFTVGTTGTLGGSSGNNKVIGTVYATNSANPSGSASPVNVTANLYQVYSGNTSVVSGTNLALTTGSSTDGGQRAGITVSNFSASNPNFVVTTANGGSVGSATATNVTATVATVGVASNRLSGTYTYTGSVTGSAAYTDPNLASQGTVGNQTWTGVSVTGTVTGATSSGTGQVKQAYVASGNSYAGYGLTSAVSGGFGQPSHPTVATILASDNASGNTTVNMNFSANGGHAVNAFQASDTLTLSGINAIGGHGPDGGSILTDTFVLQMSYVLNANDTGYYIGWWDANAPRGGAWVNAIAGNSNANLPTDYIGTGANLESYAAFNTAFMNAHPGDTLDNELGAYGYDASTDTAWAVLDHNSDFEVIPEPSTYAMIFGGFGLLIGFQNIRRRR